MTEDLDALILDLAEWVAKEPRCVTEVMEAWRTSCPRLTVWEDTLERGLVERVRSAAGEWIVVLTPAGRRLLARHDRLPAAPCS